MSDGFPRRNRRLIIALLILILIAATALFAYKYHQSQKDVKRLSNPQESAKLATQELVGKVGQLVQLPSGETPTVATVNDINKLKNQAFFTKAQNGDKVLIYTQARRAILYRPSTNKVIEIAPINIGTSSTSPSPSPSSSSQSNSTR